MSEAVHSFVCVLTAEAMLRAGPSMEMRPSMAWPNVMLRVLAWASASRIQMRPEGRERRTAGELDEADAEHVPDRAAVDEPLYLLVLRGVTGLESNAGADARRVRQVGHLSPAWAVVVPSGHSV